MNEKQLQGLADHLNQSRAEFVTALQMISDVLKALNENIKDFRGSLDRTLERVEDYYDNQWLAAAGRLVEAQEKFTASATAVCEITELLHARVQSVDDIFSAQLDMIGKHNESARNILEMFPTFFAAFSETNANIEANTKKLDALSLKVERYFGSGQGLEYDN
jgi:hypothetical protein